MDKIEYTTEKDALGAYGELLREIYAGFPQVAESRIGEATRSFHGENPFLSYGHYRNYLIRRKGKAVAHISSIIDERQPADVGLIGYFESVDDPGVAAEAFGQALRFLTAHGRRTIRGPVNFTTWQTFRVSYPDAPAPFFMEPFTRGYYRDLFRSYGFSVAQRNVSTIRSLEDSAFGQFGIDLSRSEEEGIAFESLGESGEAAEEAIYELTKAIFFDTWSFVPVSRKEFEYMLGVIAPLLDGDLVIVARSPQRMPVGFCFSAPDLYAAVTPRLVLKTLGVLPSFRGKGIGRALLHRLYDAAVQKGYPAVIASTMRIGNEPVRRIIGPADIYREYEVYEKRL